MSQFILLLSGMIVLTFAAPSYAAHSFDSTNKKLDGKNLITMKRQMESMESAYLELQLLSQSNPVNYESLTKTLSDMETSLRKIRMVNVRKGLEKDLKTLAGDMNHLQKYINNQNPIVLRNRLDKLYNQCFRCHVRSAKPLKTK